MKTPVLLLIACLCAGVVFPSTAYSQATPVRPTSPILQLKVQPKVGTKRDQQASSSYMQTMRISPEVLIEGPTTQPLPALEATMIIVTMDTRAKYTERREKYDVHSAETITVPKVDTGARRTVVFKDQMTSFDAWRDNSNVGGAVYKYFVFGLRDTMTQKLVYFETNQPALDRLVKTKPEKRDEMLKLKSGSEFPKDFK